MCVNNIRRRCGWQNSILSEINVKNYLTPNFDSGNVKNPEFAMFKHILIATDGSDLAGKAVNQGLGLAKALGAKVTVVTVTELWVAIAPGEIGMAFPVDEYEKGAADHAARVLAAATATAKSLATTCDPLHVKDRYPADGILEAANAKGADLIVMASHGRRGVSRVLIGSQANRVMVHSTVPVLICK